MLFFCSSLVVSGQEENSAVIQAGNRYIEIKIKKLDKYNSRVKRQQTRLLKILKKRERRFVKKLKKTDSTSFVRVQKQSPSYDSISKLSQQDAEINSLPRKKNDAVDSLKGVQSFVKAKDVGSANNPEMQNQNARMGKLQGQLNLRTQISQLIAQRTNDLKNTPKGNSIAGFKGIEKHVFYYSAKIKVFKDIQDEPSKAENLAMEYLQGSAGFDNAMKSSSSSIKSTANLSNGITAEEMRVLGFQTKKITQQNLEKKFGNNLGVITKNATEGLKQYQEQFKDFTGSINDTKKTLKSVSKMQKPLFKINPMRGLPFCKRFEQHFNWQAAHATSDGSAPATITASYVYGFKHTPKLTYGMGLAGALGLGQSWQNVKFSFQGIGLRSYAKCELQYGIGVYAGYERMYKQSAFTSKKVQGSEIVNTTHNTERYNESVLIGLTKSYNINKRCNGAIQVLYDIWWQQKGLQSPIVLRFETIKM
jgi:hypothetical protein